MAFMMVSAYMEERVSRQRCNLGQLPVNRLEVFYDTSHAKIPPPNIFQATIRAASILTEPDIESAIESGSHGAVRVFYAGDNAMNIIVSWGFRDSLWKQR
jgi:hypothetical protein